MVAQLNRQPRKCKKNVDEVSLEFHVASYSPGVGPMGLSPPDALIWLSESQNASVPDSVLAAGLDLRAEIGPAGDEIVGQGKNDL
jgi:hypothetical protein